MKRFIVDCVGNYLFFVPLVIMFTPALHSVDGALQYMRAAVPITIIGVPIYAQLLIRFWYKVWKINLNQGDQLKDAKIEELENFILEMQERDD